MNTASKRRLLRVPLLFSAVLALGLSLGCRRSAPVFKLAGTITIASRIQGKAPKRNSVLFIIAKNAGGVPIAVRRIVNPRFPVSFELSPDDLLVPGASPENPFLLQVQMNTHGNVGEPRPGDLEGNHRSPVHAGEDGIHVVIDKLIPPSQKPNPRNAAKR